MITIEPLELPYSNTKEGKIRLLEYQKEVLEREEKIISVNAPTGSGKTLAILKKALDSIDYGNTALFLYPTNELLTDQLNSFVKLLELMGYNCSVFDLDEGMEAKSEIKIFPINGEYLEFYSRDRTKGSTIRKMLNSPLVAESKLLILSNIDFIYNLVKGSYYRSEFIFPDLLKNLSYIAVDELHMYWGTMFFSLLFSIKTIEKRVEHIILSTATNTKNLKSLLNSLNSNYVPINSIEGKGRTVRHETKLEILGFNDAPYLCEEKHAKRVFDEALRLLDENNNSLLIFNSLMFAEKIANMLENELGDEVGKIHGFVPKNARKEMRKKRVIVGTSSIEVGVDFDRDALLFEANNAPSLIQRFGRIGRHRKGVAVAFIPFEDYKRIDKRFKNDSNIPYREFEKTVWEIMEVPEDYSELKNSGSGIEMYLSYISSLIYLTKRVYGPQKANMLKLKEVRGKLESIAKSENLNPNFSLSFLDRKVREVLSKASGAKKLVNMSKIFPRGGMPSVPVFFNSYGTFEMLTINSLEKADVEVVDSREFEDKSKPSWLKSLEKSFKGKDEAYIPLFIVGDINLNKHLKIFLSSSFNGFLERGKFRVSSDWGPKVNGIIEDLLVDLPAYFTLSKSDWRFATLRARKNNRDGYLIVGGDGILCRGRGYT